MICVSIFPAVILPTLSHLNDCHSYEWLDANILMKTWKWRTVYIFCGMCSITRWRHQMETFSALLAFHARNTPGTDEFPTKRPETRSFDVFLSWVNNGDAGDLRRYRAHYDAILMKNVKNEWNFKCLRLMCKESFEQCGQDAVVKFIETYAWSCVTHMSQFENPVQFFFTNRMVHDNLNVLITASFLMQPAYIKSCHGFHLHWW